MADLSGKVAVVTDAGGGRGRGLGLGIAEGLAEAGATIYLAGHQDDAESARSTVAQRAAALGGKAFAVPLTPAGDAALTALFERVRAEQGRLDVLVNHAGGALQPRAGAFWEHPPSLWDECCGPALRSGYAAAVLAARVMIEGGRGLIVHLATGQGGRGGGVAGGAREAALARMNRDMSRELAPHGVAALALCPAPESTAASQVAAATTAPRFTGRCVAALAMDPDILEKTGGVYRVTELQREYRFTDPDRA